MKLCKKCNVEKPQDQFPKDKQKRDGLTSYCKLCCCAEEKRRYEYRKQHKSQYKITNRDKYNAIDAKRRAKKLDATPPWLSIADYDEIENFFAAAKAFKLYTGISYHIDHIVPLQGEKVCGLHVPWNLQILTEAENISKKNSVFFEKDLTW